jgi:hypothetical protein
MKVELAVGVCLLLACGGSGAGGDGARTEQDPIQSPEAAREAARSQQVAGGETSEFSGDIGSCPEIVSTEPLDLDEPDVASWIALAQGSHEPTLGWKRMVSSDAVQGFEEHTSLSIDVNVLRGREVVYGAGGATHDEVGVCDGLSARQLELEVALATSDGAVVAAFRRWFEPLMYEGVPGGIVLVEGRLNPDQDRNPVEFSGSLELGLDPALGGEPALGVSLQFDAESVRGSLSPMRSIRDESYVLNRSSWTPIVGYFPDDSCEGNGDPIGLDEPVESLGGQTPRANYGRLAAEWAREPIPAVWMDKPFGTVLDEPPPTEVNQRGGEPTHACISGDHVLVHASLTITTADGRVNLTQPFAAELSFGNGARGDRRTPWVPAENFEAETGLPGVNLSVGGYGAIDFSSSVDWSEDRRYGHLWVQKWQAFTEESAGYPVLDWCKGSCSAALDVLRR